MTAVGLYASLPGSMAAESAAGPALRIAVPALVLALLVPLAVTAPHRHAAESMRRRTAAIGLTAVLSLANVFALGLLVHDLAHGGIHGGRLLLAAGQIWATNVIAFALWYWELDGHGPPGRLSNPTGPRDFAFTQMTTPRLEHQDWQPRFVDYLYLSFTNASAFSPADTVPLTAWAKMLMLLQSSISIVTVILVAARAVNMLG